MKPEYATWGSHHAVLHNTRNSFRQMRENLFSGNWKHSIEIWRQFVLSDGVELYFDQFENDYNQCGQKWRCE